MPQPPFDTKRASRWFAVELNNLAWGLIEAEERTPQQVEMLIHAAHGACYHWLESGDLLNHLRAQQLLATAYVTAGMPEAAVRHARKCLALGELAQDQQSPFDRACTHGCAAIAFALAGDESEAQVQSRALDQAYETLTGEGDRKVIDQYYRNRLTQ